MPTARRLTVTTAVLLALAGSLALRHPIPRAGEAIGAAAAWIAAFV